MNRSKNCSRSNILKYKIITSLKFGLRKRLTFSYISLLISRDNKFPCDHDKCLRERDEQNQIIFKRIKSDFLPHTSYKNRESISYITTSLRDLPQLVSVTWGGKDDSPQINQPRTVDPKIYTHLISGIKTRLHFAYQNNVKIYCGVALGCPRKHDTLSSITRLIFRIIMCTHLFWDNLYLRTEIYI